MRRNSLGLPPERRRVVLDEDINWKLAAELKRRGRLDATAIYIEKIDGKKDGALLKTLAAGYEPCVLVTWDNKLSKVHSAEIAHHGNTIAVVDRAVYEAKWTGDEESYVRDVVHRWLHRMEIQPRGTARRYSSSRVLR
jgi:hypothetical protein